MANKKCIFRDKYGQRKIYAYAFLSSILIITGIGLISIWYPVLLNITANKILGSSFLFGSLGALLYTLSFKESGKVQSFLVLIIAISSSLLCGLLVFEIWFNLFEKDFLAKATKTLLILAIVSGIIAAIKYDFFESKKMKDENYLD